MITTAASQLGNKIVLGDAKIQRVSPSKLTAFCMPKSCPRCCWRLLRMKFKYAFNSPPAFVLTQLDAHQKQLARVAIESGKLPGFFGACANATAVLTVESFAAYHEATDLQLFGKPDFFIQLDDDSYGITDGKTAKVKPEGHPLCNAYRLQTNFYALCAAMQPEEYDVSELGILYCEFSAMSDKEIASSFTDEDFLAKFKPVYVPVEVNPDKFVIPVLEFIRELLDAPKAPKSRKGCTDCELIDAFATLLSDDDAGDEDCTDQLRFLTRRERDRVMAKGRYSKMQDRRHVHTAAICGLSAAADPLGSLAYWDWRDEESLEPILVSEQ